MIHLDVYDDIGIEPYSPLPSRTQGGYRVAYVDREGSWYCASCAQASTQIIEAAINEVEYESGEPTLCWTCDKPLWEGEEP